MRNAKCVVRNEGRGASIHKAPQSPLLYIIYAALYELCAATTITHYAPRITHFSRNKFFYNYQMHFPCD